MKNLIDIYEKLDINKVNLNKEFPVDGTSNVIIEFLKEQGFKEIKDLPDIPFYPDYVILFNKYKNKCFGIEEGINDTTIYFANTSKKKISEGNMLYIIQTSPKIYKCRKIWGDDIEMCEFLNKDELKKEMESYFA